MLLLIPPVQSYELCQFKNLQLYAWITYKKICTDGYFSQQMLIRGRMSFVRIRPCPVYTINISCFFDVVLLSHDKNPKPLYKKTGLKTILACKLDITGKIGNTCLIPLFRLPIFMQENIPHRFYLQVFGICCLTLIFLISVAVEVIEAIFKLNNSVFLITITQYNLAIYFFCIGAWMSRLNK